MDKLKGYNVILASKSPRRHELLKGLDIPFEVRTKDVDESFSEELKAEQIPLYLAEKKADAFLSEISNDDILITSDTVVWLGDKVFNKPESVEEAISMLETLSGNAHEVYTAVCVVFRGEKNLFYDKSTVYFGNLTPDEIEHYITRYRPFDKAGAYGIQEWIGYAAIERMEGSFYNVMGLPTRKLYECLKNLEL